MTRPILSLAALFAFAVQTIAQAPKPKEAVDVEAAVRKVIAEELKVDAKAVDMKKPISADVDKLASIIVALGSSMDVQITNKLIEKHTGKGDLADKKVTPEQLAAIAADALKAKKK